MLRRKKRLSRDCFQRLAHPQGVRSLGDLCGSGVRLRRALKPGHRKTKNRDNTHSGLSRFSGTEPKLGQPWASTGRSCLTSDSARSKQEDERPSHSLLVSRTASTLGYYYFYFPRRDIKKQILQISWGSISYHLYKKCAEIAGKRWKS